MKTVGIIGGLGPKTTSRFYLEVSSMAQKINKDNRPPIIMYSVPISYKVEKEAITRGRRENNLFPLLIKASSQLENCGADFLVMPCNSLHSFIEKIKNIVKIPIISMPEKTAFFLKKNNISRIGFLSTSITIKNKIYEKSFLENNIEQVNLTKLQQKKINGIIHNLVSNKQKEEDKKELIKIIKYFEKNNVNNILLACTDLQLIDIGNSNARVLDSMKILAEATAKEIFK